MRGDLIIVKCHGGQPSVRRLWDQDKMAVYVTNDEQLSLLLEGKTALWPIGFPREDVFKYDPKLAASMDQLFREGKWDWNKLEPI